jgi:hypothetical protein
MEPKYYKDPQNMFIYKIISISTDNPPLYGFEQVDEKGEKHNLGGYLDITDLIELTEIEYQNELIIRNKIKEELEEKLKPSGASGGGEQKKTQKIQAKNQPKEASHKKKFQEIESRFFIEIKS